MFGISVGSMSIIFSLISIGIVCYVTFLNYTRNLDMAKRIRRFEKGMEDINNEIFKISRCVSPSRDFRGTSQ